MPDIVTNVLYQDIDRLQEKVKELEAERDADRPPGGDGAKVGLRDGR